ncbi:MULTISPECIES: restriction endonuclease subunit S [Chryseobacterium]|uniref:restriction endonuclease subunit S n=1 Tax=Chryseobacterium TaxID=59732 RepID=UPI00195C6D21|nr:MULTISPECIES: restriction endonuclease subunit S [Chryseobacterium]MBM7420462.1 type I restriction enzyme S subunit [Chryseobacterium sp. JUb44]MDH6210411.1 type I restriction enzyme S subunit [Chryseobacterium sp. BIGb0186]WSO09112.1 restriction endonuclease subunit S [Chryseobacterium scophthalmum]
MKFVKLADIVTIKKGKKPIFSKSPNEKSARVLQIGDLRDDSNIKYTDEISGVLVNEEDILLAWDGANAGTIGYGKTGYIGSTIAVLRKKNSKDYATTFIGKFLQSQFKYLRSRATGATIPHIDRKTLESLKLPVIDVAEQNLIAQLLTKAENLIIERKDSIVLLDELIKNCFLKMFGDPVTNGKKYNSVILDNICDNIFLGLTSKVDYVEEGGYPLIRATDINSGKLAFKNVKYISERQHKLITKNRITKKGDLLVSKSGSLGTCAIVDSDKEFTTYESIITIQSKKEFLNNYYLLYLIRNNNFQTKMLGGKVGGTVGHLNLQMFRNMKINLPPIELQSQFAAIVEKVENLKTNYEACLKELENMYGILSQKAFKGELNLSNVDLELSKEDIKIQGAGSLESPKEVEKFPIFLEKKKRIIDISLDEYYEIPEDIVAKYGSIEVQHEDKEFLLKKIFYDIPIDLNKLEEIYNKKNYEKGSYFVYEDWKEFIFKELSKSNSFIKQKFNTKSNQIELLINEIKKS